MSHPPRVPHDRVDLYLAPAALRLDAWLDEWSHLSEHDVKLRTALATDEEPRDLSDRRQAIIRTVEQDVEMHGWAVDIVDRGLRLHHDGSQVVLGLPASLQRFLSDPDLSAGS